MRIAKPVLVLLASVAVAPLAACKVDNRPLLTQLRGEPPPPQAAALPQPAGPYEAAPGYGYGYGYNQPSPPPGYRPGPRRIAYQPARAWPYAERVYALDSAFYDLPPDYGFYYGDEQPWVWETSYDDLMFAEPWGDDYRFYYYEPGAAWPYFVADPNYGYAFGSDGALIALFTAAGVLLAEDDYDRYWPTAEQYWSRGLDLRQAYVGSPRYAVTQAVWSQRAPLITRNQTSWIRAGQSQPDWRDWRTRSGQDFVQRYAPERQRRVAMLQAPRNGGAPMTRGVQGGPQREMRTAEARGPGRMRMAPQAGFQAQPRFQGPRERGPARLAEARPHGRPETAFAAPQAGRPAVFRGAEAHGGGRRGGPQQDRFAAASPQVQFHGGGRQGGTPQERFASAPPQAQFHGGGGGGRHGGQGGPPAQAFAQAQPQAPQQPHGNPHQGGGGAGGGQASGGQGGGGPGQGKGDQKDHGHGRGR